MTWDVFCFGQGADPCLVNKDDLPLLHVAVKNKHAEAIPVIIQAGADVNKKGPPSMWVISPDYLPSVISES